jgi:hypothetical protein
MISPSLIRNQYIVDGFEMMSGWSYFCLSLHEIFDWIPDVNRTKSTLTLHPYGNDCQALF